MDKAKKRFCLLGLIMCILVYGSGCGNEKNFGTDVTDHNTDSSNIETDDVNEDVIENETEKKNFCFRVISVNSCRLSVGNMLCRQ